MAQKFKFGDRVKTKERFGNLPCQTIIFFDRKNIAYWLLPMDVVEKLMESELLPDDNWISASDMMPEPPKANE